MYVFLLKQFFSEQFIKVTKKTFLISIAFLMIHLYLLFKKLCSTFFKGYRAMYYLIRFDQFFCLLIGCFDIAVKVEMKLMVIICGLLEFGL